MQEIERLNRKLKETSDDLVLTRELYDSLKDKADVSEFPNTATGDLVARPVRRAPRLEPYGRRTRMTHRQGHGLDRDRVPDYFPSTHSSSPRAAPGALGRWARQTRPRSREVTTGLGGKHVADLLIVDRVDSPPGRLPPMGSQNHLLPTSRIPVGIPRMGAASGQPCQASGAQLFGATGSRAFTGGTADGSRAATYFPGTQDRFDAPPDITRREWSEFPNSPSSRVLICAALRRTAPLPMDPGQKPRDRLLKQPSGPSYRF